MEKMANFAYGDVVLPTGRTRRDFYVNLIRNDDTVVQSHKVVYDEPAFMVDVPNGTGWKFQVINYDDLGQPIGDPVVSDPFDVVVPTSIVIGVSVS